MAGVSVTSQGWRHVPSHASLGQTTQCTGRSCNHSYGVSQLQRQGSGQQSNRGVAIVASAVRKQTAAKPAIRKGRAAEAPLDALESVSGDAQGHGGSPAPSEDDVPLNAAQDQSNGRIMPMGPAPPSGSVMETWQLATEGSLLNPVYR